MGDVYFMAIHARNNKLLTLVISPFRDKEGDWPYFE